MLMKYFLIFYLFENVNSNHKSLTYYLVEGDILSRDINLKDNIYRSHKNAPYYEPMRCSQLFGSINTSGISLVDIRKGNVCVGIGTGFEKDYLLQPFDTYYL